MENPLLKIPLSEIDPGTRNSRKTFSDIEALAQDILAHGLISNLVVSRKMDGRYELVAGERRYRALKSIDAQKLWCSLSLPSVAYLDVDIPVIHCLVKDDPGMFLNMVENIQREEVPIWHLGSRFNEMLETGVDQNTIAARIHKSQTYVSGACMIARGLAAKTVRALDKMGPNALTRSQLIRLSKLIDYETFVPDEAGQIKELDRMLTTKRPLATRKRDAVPKSERVWIRFKSLERGIKAPAWALPVVDAVMRYLSGADDRLKFPDGS